MDLIHTDFKVFKNFWLEGSYQPRQRHSRSVFTYTSFQSWKPQKKQKKQNKTQKTLKMTSDIILTSHPRQFLRFDFPSRQELLQNVMTVSKIKHVPCGKDCASAASERSSSGSSQKQNAMSGGLWSLRQTEEEWHVHTESISAETLVKSKIGS